MTALDTSPASPNTSSFQATCTLHDPYQRTRINISVHVGFSSEYLFYLPSLSRYLARKSFPQPHHTHAHILSAALTLARIRTRTRTHMHMHTHAHVLRELPSQIQNQRQKQKAQKRVKGESEYEGEKKQLVVKVIIRRKEKKSMEVDTNACPLKNTYSSRA